MFLAARPRKMIFVEQDGVKLHTGKGVMEAIQDAAGHNIILETQAANSSDLNVHELGFFHSIQHLKEEIGVTDSKELVEATMEAFNAYPRETLEQVWWSLLADCGKDMVCKGDNSYKIPHLGKEELDRAGNLLKNARVGDGKYRAGMG
ncbi:unnamed protein product, partial [Discosporangium mesarthrocarpum]